MYQSNLNSLSLRSALLLGATSFAAVSMAGPAMAQDQSVETVVVTGSRIPQQGINAASPVTVVGSEDIKLTGTTKVEDLLNTLPGVVPDFSSTDSNGSLGTATVNLRGLGATRTLVLVDGKRLMPGDVFYPVADLNNIPSALVDRVEVLTGGASAVYGSDAEAGVVNFIMRKDFEGVELDGNWSVHSAANGNSLFENIQDAAGFAKAPRDWWGGENADATLILGTNTADGKGNITAYLNYQNTQAVLQTKRDFSACSIGVYLGYIGCVGSSNKNRWISYDNIGSGLSKTLYDFYETGTGSPGSGQFGYFGNFPNGENHFNYGPLNYLQRPDTRYTGGYFAHYQVNKKLDVYSSFMFEDDHTLAQIAPTAAFLGSGPTNYPGTQSPGYLMVNCSNPLMTLQENQSLCGTILPSSIDARQKVNGSPNPYYNDTFFNEYGAGGPFGNGYDSQVGGVWDGAANITPGQSLLQIGRRNIEGGNRVADLRHTAYRMVVGAKGDLGHGWSYDVYGQYGVTVYNQTYENEWSKTRVQNALQVDPNTGQCYVSEANSIGIVLDPNCVPLDIFNGIGSVTPTMEGYVGATGLISGYTEEQVISGSLTGDLGEWGIQSPWAKNPVEVALGAEWRAEYLMRKTSRNYYVPNTSDLFGQGGPTYPIPLSGFNVKEGFGEIKVPVIQDQPFFEDLSLNGGFRYSSYSTVGAVTSWKAGAEWQPIDDFRIRASYQRATRAPNVLESFTPVSIGLFGGVDPCANQTTGQCATVPNAGSSLLDCPAAQCNAQFGGNVNLKPETSTTRSIGVVFTPTFIDGFQATVDYWDIKIADYISYTGPNTILQGCYSSGDPAQEAYYCPLVHRSAGGQIYGAGYVQAINQNLPYLHTSGVDFKANYQTDMSDWGLVGWGSLFGQFMGTYLEKTVTLPSTFSNPHDCAGYYGSTCGVPEPKWTHSLRMTWSSPWDFDVSVNWQHIGGVNLDADSFNPDLGGGAPLYSSLVSSYPCAAGLGGIQDCHDRHIPAQDYFDVSGTWTVHAGVQLRAGIKNIFDRSPPWMDSGFFGVSTPPYGNGNTYPNIYPSMGRTFFVGATIKY